MRFVAHIAVVFRLNRLKRCDNGVGDGVFQIAVALAREFLDGGVGRLTRQRAVNRQQVGYARLILGTKGRFRNRNP